MKFLRYLRVIVTCTTLVVSESCLIGRACAQAASALSNPVIRSKDIAIQPLTEVNVAAKAGYFPDPFPIHFTHGVGSTGTLTFSGTNQSLLTCAEPVKPGSGRISPITVDFSRFRQQAKNYGNTLPNIGNNNIYQDARGHWQMATTLHLSNGTVKWNVIAHASPTNTGNPVPTAWVADVILVGSLQTPAKADYDGKYFEDGGCLYLLYSKALQAYPLHDGVVAQLMQSSTQPAATPPVTLIEPTDENNGFNSEYYLYNMSSPFKLVETGNVTKINGKYAIAYSTGDFQQPSYKAGVAWSDSFLPPLRQTYKKVLMEDVSGVWGQLHHLEVRYLLQAQKSDWPDYVFDQVFAPGVPSIVQDPSGTWYLFFAAYDPKDAPLLPNSANYDPKHRRPYFVELQVNVPKGRTVRETPDSQLATWIIPRQR